MLALRASATVSRELGTLDGAPAAGALAVTHGGVGSPPSVSDGPEREAYRIVPYADYPLLVRAERRSFTLFLHSIIEPAPDKNKRR